MDASTISEPMRRVLDALLAGEPVPPEAQARLTDAERAEVASLARTAHLTKLTLAKPEPTADMEAAALARAHAAMAQRSSTGGAGMPAIPDSPFDASEGSREAFPSLLSWLIAKITGRARKRKDMR